MGVSKALSYCAWAPALVLGASAAAQDILDETRATPALLAELANCRALTDAESKAACYDAAVDKVLSAVESGDLVAVERSEIEEARRDSIGLPSFHIPGLGMLNSSDEDEEPVTVRIVTLERSQLGAISFDTDTGQHWVQVGSDRAPLMPDAPLDAEITPAFGDTWFVAIPGRSPIRVKRER